MVSELDFVVSKLQAADIARLVKDTGIPRTTLYRIRGFNRKNPQHWPRLDYVEKLRAYFHAQESAA